MIFWSPVYAEGKVVYTVVWVVDKCLRKSILAYEQSWLRVSWSLECHGDVDEYFVARAFKTLGIIQKNEEEENISSQVNFGIWLKINQILMV